MQYFTIVGVGPKGGYKETQYTFEDDKKHVYESKFVQEAIIKRYKDVLDEAVFFVTKESKEKYADEIKQRFNKTLKIKFVDIEANISFEEFSSKLFEYMKDGEDVIIDITHGFRHIPMKLLFSLRYIELTKNMKIQHLFYGLLVDPNKTHIIGKYKGLIIDFIKEYELQNVSELLSQFDRTLLINPKDIEEVVPNKDVKLSNFLKKLSALNKVLECAEFNKSMEAIENIISACEDLSNKNEKYSLLVPLVIKIENKFNTIVECKTDSQKKIALIKLLMEHNRSQIVITFLDQFFRDSLINKTLNPRNKAFDLKEYCAKNNIKYKTDKAISMLNFNLSQYLMGTVYEIREDVKPSNEQVLKTCIQMTKGKDSNCEKVETAISPYKEIIKEFYGKIRNSMNHGQSVKESVKVDKVLTGMIECLENM